MGVAETSRLAYQDAQAEGVTGNQQRRILETLTAAGTAMTRKQLAVVLSIDPGSIAGRVDELVRCGRVVDGPSMKCPVTGRQAKGVRLS